MTCCQAETTASHSCTVDKHVHRRHSWRAISIAVYYRISYDSCLGGTWSHKVDLGTCCAQAISVPALTKAFQLWADFGAGL